MKIDCPCGNELADNTDYIPYKASLIADQDHEDLMEALHARHSHAWDALRSHVAATVFQCAECSRLIVLRDGRQYTFSPDAAVPRVVNSVHGGKWKRCLVAHWRNGAGELFWDDSGEHPERASFPGALETGISSWEALESRYRNVLQQLEAAGQLRSALLTREGVVTHRWSQRIIEANP